MALIFADRVKETTTSTGTGDLTLAGAVAGFEPFSSVCADGDTAYYCVTDGTSWEVGLGTYAANVLTRTSVLSSSNAGAAVALNPGSKDVVLTVPAAVISEFGSDIAALIALVTFYGPFAGFPASATSGQFAIASDQSNTLYVWTGGNWAIPTVAGIDSTARASANSALALATTAQPAIAPGDPTTAGAPTDGSLVYYFDNSTTPYTMWVWDGVWAQVQ